MIIVSLMRVYCNAEEVSFDSMIQLPSIWTLYALPPWASFRQGCLSYVWSSWRMSHSWKTSFGNLFGWYQFPSCRLSSQGWEISFSFSCDEPFLLAKHSGSCSQECRDLCFYLGLKVSSQQLTSLRSGYRKGPLFLHEVQTVKRELELDL